MSARPSGAARGEARGEGGRRRLRAAVSGLSGLAALALPRAAFACAVCFSGPDETRGAFMSTTVGMSVLPLALIGGIIWWLRRQVKAAERAETVRVREVLPGLRARES